MTESGTGDGKRFLVKLVRDRIGKFVDGLYLQVTYKPMPTDQVVEKLRQKLGEECTEYLINPSIG